MPKLTLQFEGRLLKEYTGRRGPDDRTPARQQRDHRQPRGVGSSRARVLRKRRGDSRGSEQHERHVRQRAARRRASVLRSGDVAAHRQAPARVRAHEEWSAPPPQLPALGDTVYLDTKQHRELLSTLEDARAQANARPAQKTPPAPRRVGMLQVIAGRAEQTEYDLDAHTSLIGKSNSALVRLHGWFKPAVARGDRAQQRRLRRHADGRPDDDQQRAARAAPGASGRRRAERQRARAGVPLEGRRRHRVGRLDVRPSRIRRAFLSHAVAGALAPASALRRLSPRRVF